jgi:hypothetical protein
MMPVMKMARLPLNIAKTSIAAAQHFISEMAAAVIACSGVMMGAVCAPPCLFSGGYFVSKSSVYFVSK